MSDYYFYDRKAWAESRLESLENEAYNLIETTEVRDYQQFFDAVGSMLYVEDLFECMGALNEFCVNIWKQYREE